MGYEESKKHLLSLSYNELQSLCKRYNLPANKTHTQLASSLASLLEASLATSPAALSSVKEASTGSQFNLKRGPYSGRDDDIPLVHAKHKKGPQTVVDETSKRGINTSSSICPVSISSGRPDCHGRSSSEPGNAHNVQSQSAVGIANKSTNPELASEHHGSPANMIDQTSAPIIQKRPVIDDGLASAPSRHTEDDIGKGCGPSDMISANARTIQFFVMKDEGIDLVVDLDSTPSTWAENVKAEVNLCMPPDLQPGNVSSFISSLVSKDDHSTISPSGNIVVDVQSKRAKSIAPSTNSSLGSDAGDNSHSEPYPADRTTVNSVSSASTMPSTLVELSGYQEGAPVVSSSCLTADVQNNMTSHSLMTGALDNNVLPPESVDVLARSERITAALIDASVQSTGYKDMMNPGKTKVSGKIGCTQTVSVADTDSLSAFSSGDVVRSASNGNSCPKSAGKQIVDIPGGAQLAQNGSTHEVLMEPMEALSMEKDTGSGDRLSISCQLARQTIAKLPVTEAQSDASSADQCMAGNFDLTNPTSSSAASDNAVNPLTSKCGAESAQSHDSADKSRVCDPEELELESKTPPAYGEPPRSILLSLRSASARQTKPSTLRRRSARLVPK
uniref:SAP domain-containing protein n=1 Tax=Arundo donax TaxID=35708 RepID=A0A0A9E7R7_ARUDO